MFPARQRDERRQKQRDDSVKQPPLRASVQLQLNERRSDRPAVWLSIWLSGYMAIWLSGSLTVWRRSQMLVDAHYSIESTTRNLVKC
jgi:hypothetical protein